MTNHEHRPNELAMAELLDLDGEVLHAYRSDMTAWLAELVGGQPPRRILDLGSGTGTGTFALLERFPQANATALDISGQMLHHLRNKASTLGLDDRVHTIQSDLDAPWPALDTVDLAWAASSLHHMANPDHVLNEVFRTLRPGGLLAITEMDSFPRFLPDHLGLGRPGLEARAHAARLKDNNDPTSPLLRAGFVLEAKRPFVIDLQRPLPEATGRYARVCLQHLRAHLDGLLDGEDLTTLDILIDSNGPDGVLRRLDLKVRTTRTGWVAKRPR